MKKFFIAVSLTALAGSAGAFELQQIGAAALRGTAVRGLPEVKQAVAADRVLEDDMIHGAIPSDGGANAAIPGWANMIYDWEDNRPLVRPGELSGGNYAEKSQAEKAMRDWVGLLRLAGIQPKSYGVSAVTGRPWRFTIVYPASVRLQCAGAGAFKDYAQAVRSVQAAAGRYEAAGKKVAAIMISNSYNSDTPYYAWVYYADQIRKTPASSGVKTIISCERDDADAWVEVGIAQNEGPGFRAYVVFHNVDLDSSKLVAERQVFSRAEGRETVYEDAAKTLRLKVSRGAQGLLTGDFSMIYDGPNGPTPIEEKDLLCAEKTTISFN